MTLHRCVGGIMVREGTILLGLRAAERTFYPNVWDMFGGHIEAGEKPHDTLVRELQEELGITPTWYVHLRTVELSDDGEMVELWCYAVMAWDGAPTNLQPHEHARIAWFTPEQAVRLALAHPSYAELFAAALA